MRKAFFPIAVLLLSLVAGAQTIGAVADQAHLKVSAPEVRTYFATPANSDVLTAVLKVTPEIPRGPDDIAQMQFQLFTAWHTISEQAVAQTSVAEPKAGLLQTGEAVVVALPFSSLQLNSSLQQYLKLTSEQTSAIQQVMVGQRRHLDPMMAELDATGHKLEAARNTHSDPKEIHSLAVAQARLLSKFAAENSDLQAKISHLLNPEQRKKIEKLKQANELSDRGGE